MADQRREPEQRPSPEALLAELKREEKGEVGRLKIFLGAAAGVGKTYEMLLSARAKRKLGIDVGVVETHGRKETEVPLRRRDRTASWLGPCTVSSAHEKACEQTAMRLQHQGQRALRRPALTEHVAENAMSDHDLRADLDHAVRGDSEISCRILCRSREPYEELLLPERHL
jgi:hypothetical protein